MSSPASAIPRATPNEMTSSGERPLGVCFVCSDYPPGPHGGIGTITQVLARALARGGHRVRVIGVYPSEYPAQDSENDNGVEVLRLREARGKGAWLLARVSLFRRVARWAAAGEVDLVEVPDWAGWAAGWPRLPVPVVARLHGSATYFGAEAGRPAPPLTRWLDRVSLERADFVCSTSRYTATRTETLARLRRPMAGVIYSPMDVPPAASRRQRTEPAVVFTGILAEKKGVIPLIRAWPMVIAREPAARLHLYGKDGRTAQGSSMRVHLESLLADDTRSTVQFHGHVGRERLFEVLGAARAAVFPSFAEAFALAPLEAMAAGCPTVFSTRGSGPELIRHGHDGLLVDPDRPEDIAAALLRLLGDDRLAERIGCAGRARILEAFSVDALVAQNLRFYRQCLTAFRPAATHA